jgi:hypothetical protein
VFNEHDWKDYYQEWYTHDTKGVIVVIGIHNGLTPDESLTVLKTDDLPEVDLADDAITQLSSPDAETLHETVHNDAFVFGKRFGHDVVVNFQAGAGAGDVLQLNRVVFKDWSSILQSAKQSGNDVIITAEKDNSLILKNLMLSNLSADDFRFVA